VNAREKLTAARSDVVERIEESVLALPLTGVMGEADCGKTLLCSIVCANARKRGTVVISLDLDGAYSPNQLAWRWAKELARAVIDPVALSHLGALGQDMWPARTRNQILSLGEHLGEEVAALAELPSPHHGVGDLDAIASTLAATGRLAQERDTLIVIDHLEAPSLTPRHPLNVAQLLWRVRAVTQLQPRLRALLVSRTPAVKLATAPTAAFYGDGQWLTVTPPSPEAFATGTGRSQDLVKLVLSRTSGHVNGTLELLEALPIDAAVTDVEEATRALAALHTDLTRRTIQHARTLHRLGGHILQVIAEGKRPYQETPDARSKEIGAAVSALHIAGIIRRLDALRQKNWAITDPRVAWGLAPITGGLTE
jgi:hypothetical protein